MPSFEDVANSLGQLVVQVSANAVRSNELAKSTKETYETTLNYLQEMRKDQKDQQELIEELKQRLRSRRMSCPLRSFDRRAVGQVSQGPNSVGVCGVPGRVPEWVPLLSMSQALRTLCQEL